MISVKKTPLKSFKDFVHREKPKDWNEIHTRKKYPNLYDDTKVALVNEQGGVGAYTEEPLPRNPHDTHIDHFCKRDLFPNMTYDWNNLFVDSISENYGAKFKDKHIKKADYALLISPAETDVERFFTYMENGEIVVAKGLFSAHDAKRAAFTIKMFNLADSRLTAKRATVIKSIRACPDLTQDDIRAAMQGQGFRSIVESILA